MQYKEQLVKHATRYTAIFSKNCARDSIYVTINQKLDLEGFFCLCVPKYTE
jgi:hypothetical protein